MDVLSATFDAWLSGDADLTNEEPLGFETNWATSA
jgi:hypothetical protein